MARSPQTRLLDDLAELTGLSARQLTRYAAGSFAGNMGALGWLKALWNTVFGGVRRGATLKGSQMPRAVQQTVEALQALAPTPETRRTGLGGSFNRSELLPEAQPQRTGLGGGIKPPGISRTAGDLPPGAAPFPQTVIPREPPRPGEQSQYGEEIFTPQSSNVFSFSYFRPAGSRLGTLYVTYKASGLNPGSVSVGQRQHGKSLSRQQSLGTRGSTVRGKKNERGPTYAYSQVPPAVYTGMKNAVSKGKFVWDKLRIRGTIYGHRYNYALVQAQVTPGVGAGTYIPRKATPKGFRTRSIANVGSGRRGFQTSTLPQQNGFSTRRRR